MEDRRRNDPGRYDLIGQAERELGEPIPGTYEAEVKKAQEADDLRDLDHFEEKDPEWLVPGYIPKKQITMLCGTGGTGKTSVWISLIASLSSGQRTLFDGSGEFAVKREPMRCMFFSGEDTVENVIKRKLREQKANMKQILTMSLSDPNFDKIQFGSDYLEEKIAWYRPAICVFDPLQSFIDKRVRMADRNAMRQSMRSLIEWGELYGTTFVIVMHTNKQLNVWGRNRMADSADLWDIARSVLMVGDTGDEGIKYMSHEKSNYGKTGQTMLFRNDLGNPTFYAWSDLKDRDYVQEDARKRNDQRAQGHHDEIVNTIMSTLSDYPEGLPAKDLKDLLRDLGYGINAIERVKSGLKESGRIVYKKSNLTSGWVVKKA